MSSHDNHPELDRALRALRAASANDAPPPSVDTAIARAIAKASKPRFVLRLPTLAWLVAPAAVAAVALVVVTQRASFDRDADRAPTQAQSPDGVDARVATQFVPMVPIAELERADSALIVPARVPRMSLAELGLPVNPARADDAIDAELLVRRDGTLLAVRFTY